MMTSTIINSIIIKVDNYLSRVRSVCSDMSIRVNGQTLFFDGIVVDIMVDDAEIYKTVYAK